MQLSKKEEAIQKGEGISTVRKDDSVKVDRLQKEIAVVNEMVSGREPMHV